MAVLAKNQWIYSLLFLWICAWYPIFDPTVMKLAVVPLLFCTLKPDSKFAKFLFIVLVFMIGMLLQGDPYDRRFWLAEILCMGFWMLGMRHSRLNSAWFAISCSLGALILLLAQRWELLPWQWNQHILVFDGEIMGKTNTLPSFFPTPGNMLLCFVLLTSFLKESSLKFKISFILITIYPVIQSGSSLGTVLYLIAITHLFLDERWRLLILSSMLSLLFVLICLPREETLRPLKNRMLLWKPALKAIRLEAQGFAYFHKFSGSLLSPETTSRKISRNQFHPHNDLLHFGLAFGLWGVVLRLGFYLYVLYLVFKLKSGLILALFLFQIQLTPDAMSYPTGPLFFFLLGQLHARCFGTDQFKSPKAGLFTLRLALGIFMIYPCAKMIQTSWQHLGLTHGHLSSEPYYPTPSYDYNQAALHMKSGDLPAAIQSLEKLDEIAPNFHDSRYLLGLAHAKQGNLTRAADILRKWIIIDPQHLHSYLLLADILKKEMKLTEAEEVLRQGILCLPEIAILKKELETLDSYSSSSFMLQPPQSKPSPK